MDNDGDKQGSIMASEPGVLVDRSTHRAVLSLVEQQADEALQALRGLESRRDICVRDLGTLLEQIDRARREHGRLTSIVRTLTRPPG